MRRGTRRDIADDLHTDPAGPGLLAIGLGGPDVEAGDQRLLAKGRFVYDALYAWCQRQVPAPVRSAEKNFGLWCVRSAGQGPRSGHAQG